MVSRSDTTGLCATVESAVATVAAVRVRPASAAASVRMVEETSVAIEENG